MLQSCSNKVEEIYFTENRESTILFLHKLALGGEEGKIIIANFFPQHLDNSTADNKYQMW